MLEMYKKTVLENYANFNGRARRKEYWMFILSNVLVFFAFVILNLIPFLGIIFLILFPIFVLGIMIPSIAVAIRRMHDVGKSGWFVLVPFYRIILLATEGDKGPNQYGADPKNQLEDISEIGKDLNKF